MKSLYTIAALVFGLSLNAKTIYIADSQGIKISQTVDPAVKVWVLKDQIFRGYAVDSSQYALAIKTAEGFVELLLDNPLGNYGQDKDAPAVLYVVAKNQVSSQETPPVQEEVTAPEEASPQEKEPASEETTTQEEVKAPEEMPIQDEASPQNEVSEETAPVHEQGKTSDGEI